MNATQTRATTHYVISYQAREMLATAARRARTLARTLEIARLAAEKE